MKTTNTKAKNRYLILAAGMVIQFCAGIIYGWSVFRGPVAAHLSWDAGAAGLTSSVMLAMFVLGIILGGWAQDKLGPKIVTLAGSMLIGIGMASSALVTPEAPGLIYLTYGIIAGLGVGTVYMSTIAAVQKWFPDRRGFASGMIVCAFGFSLVVLAPLAKAMLASPSLGVSATFLIFGVGFMIICGLSSLAIVNPSADHIAELTRSAAAPAAPAAPTAPAAPASATAPASAAPASAAAPAEKKQYKPSEVIKTLQFYLLAGGLLFTLPAYFILNPVFLTLGSERGLSEGLAVVGVTLTGISSAAGRLIVAWVSDKIGRKGAMVSIAVIILIASLVMIIGENVLFLVCIMLISFGFGGAASVYSAMTAESFGTKYGGMNFGLVMIGFGVSALVSQNVSKALTADGSYTSSFILAAVTCVIAIALVLLMKNPSKQATT